MTRVGGRLPYTPDARDYTFAPPTLWDGISYVDLTSGFPEAPYDQGDLGSCVSNGVAAAMDYARVKQGLPALERPARLFIYWWGRYLGGYPIGQDTGLQVRDGLAVVTKKGAPPETDYPYDVAAFAATPTARADTDGTQDEATVYGAVAQSDIDHTIASGYPVVFGVDLRQSFESAEVAASGIVPDPTASDPDAGGHCMLIVSTPIDGVRLQGGIPGVLYRKVRNSWSTAWGLGGYCWVPVNILDGQASSDFWMITHVTDPNAPTPAPTPAPTNTVPAWLQPLVTAVDNLAADTTAVEWLDRRHTLEPSTAPGLVHAVLAAPRT